MIKILVTRLMLPFFARVKLMQGDGLTSSNALCIIQVKSTLKSKAVEVDAKVTEIHLPVRDCSGKVCATRTHAHQECTN